MSKISCFILLLLHVDFCRYSLESLFSQVQFIFTALAMPSCLHVSMAHIHQQMCLSEFANLFVWICLNLILGALRKYTNIWWFHWKKYKYTSCICAVHSNDNLRVRQNKNNYFELFISTRPSLSQLSFWFKGDAGQSEICIYAGDGSTTMAIFSSWMLHQTVHWSHPVSPNGSFIYWGSTASNGSKQIQCIHLSSWAI